VIVEVKMREFEWGEVESDPFDCHLTVPLPNYDPRGQEQKKVEWLEEQVNRIFDDLESLQMRLQMMHCELQTQVPSPELDEVRDKVDSIESKLVEYLITKVGFTYDEVEDGVRKLVFIGTGE